MAIPVIRTAVTRTALRGPDPAEHAFRVEEEQPEPVGGQHEGEAEDGEERIEQGVREQRSLGGRLSGRDL